MRQVSGVCNSLRHDGWADADGFPQGLRRSYRVCTGCPAPHPLAGTSAGAAQSQRLCRAGTFVGAC